MKKIKKIFAVLLSLAMVLGMSMTTFAADDIIGNADDEGQLIVNGITKEEGISVNAYKIVQANYENDSFTGYTVVDGYNFADYTNPSAEEIAKAADYAKATAGLTSYPLTFDEETGSYKSETNLPVGAYVIIVEGSDTYSYNPAVASIGYINKDGENQYDTGKETVDMSTDNSVWVKKSGLPAVDKKATTDGEGNTDKGTSANIGDNVIYTVEVKPIPSYTGKYPVLNVVDTLSSGLTYNGNDKLSVTIEGETLVAGTDYVVEEPVANPDGTTTITVDFAKDNVYKLNDYAGKTAVITYSATLNENAKLNEISNGNDVILNYTKDSKTNGNDTTDESKTYTYTFDIDGEVSGTTGIITKVGEGENSEFLNGAIFKLYAQTEADKETKPSYEALKTRTPYMNKNFPTGSVESADGGQLHITGLAAGTYYLVETKAPNNYSVNTHVFEVKISATYYEAEDEGITNALQVGMLKTWSVEIDGTQTASFSVNNEGTSTPDIGGTDIPNTKISSLPSTGGIGTTIFTIGGCLIMIAAAGLFFASRRKSAK